MTERSIAELYKTKLNLQPHPEGGYFADSYQSTAVVKPLESQYGGENRHAGNSVYFLLDGDDFSAWHKLKSDEIWFYHDGNPLQIHIINKKGEFITHVLGSPLNYDEAKFQVEITRGCWFAAELIDKHHDSFCLANCIVQPSFEYKDFTLANAHDIASLIEKCPQHAETIKRLDITILIKKCPHHIETIARLAPKEGKRLM